MELTQLQVWVIGLISSLLVLPLFALIEKLVSWVLTKLNKPVPFDLGKGLKTIVVALVAGLITGAWYPNLIPDLPALKVSVVDLATFFKALGIVWNWFTVVVTALTPFVGAATLIYNAILDKLVNKEQRVKVAAAWSSFWK